VKEAPKIDFNQELKPKNDYESGDNVSHTVEKEEENEEYGVQEDSQEEDYEMKFPPQYHNKSRENSSV